MYAHVAEMIFGSQYPHVDIAQRYQPRALVDGLQRRAVEFLQSVVQVDGAHIDGSSTKYL
jgi:hypothetical protein